MLAAKDFLGPWLATLLGGGLVLTGAYYLIRTLRARRWPWVLGEIAETHMIHVQSNRGSTDYPYVAYRYEVNGQPYRNDRVRFGPVIGPQSRIPGFDPNVRPPDAQTESEFPVHRRTTVYYNPKDPSDSVLYRTPDWSVPAFIVLGGTLIYLTRLIG